jgi:transposase
MQNNKEKACMTKEKPATTHPNRLLKNRLDFSYKERVFEKKEPEKQEEFWIETRRLPRLSAGRFFQGVDEVLAEIGFGEQVHQLCRPAYSQRSDGRPGIDPVVYFKMLIVGFFENLPSERAIAARCEDSLAVRAFLGYSLEEATPDHSSLSVIRRRLSAETYQAVFELILKALKNCGLLKGRYLGIDSSVMEANASLKSLVVRNTEEAYWDYVRKLAQEAGIDAKDDRAVRQFDRKRPNKKLSNKQFKNRHDPEAKISRQKGKTDLVYKPENSVDMESGTIIQAQLVAGDQCDSVELPQRVQLVQQVLQQLRPKQKLKAVVADSNYHSLANVCALQQAGFKVLIADSNAPKRQEHLLEPSQRQALQKARQDLQSKSGRLFMRLRGQHIERSFAHILDCGGMRKATLRGQLNLQKRYVFAAACYNLSQLLRARFGCGTLRMTLASRLGPLSSFVLRLKWLPNLLFGNATRHPLLRLYFSLPLSSFSLSNTEKARFSTVC